jgi:Fe-Mn family superoxide dismutase
MYQEKKFDIGTLDGLSEKQISEHLKLYAGYVKNVNAIESELARLMQDSAANAIELSELKRRYAFEWNGMRLHELYFDALGNATAPNTESPLAQAITKRWGSWDAFMNMFKAMGVMRGIGWVLLVHDTDADMLQAIWVSDHEVGQLAGAKVLLAMDMWEHAFLLDYLPSGKKDYIEAFFKNLSWKKIEERFGSAR